MKYIITENQYEKMGVSLELFLNDYLSDLDSLCGIKVFLDEEGKDEIEYKIHIIINKSYIDRFNDLGKNNLRVSLKNKVIIAISKYMPGINYSISSYAVEC